MKTNHPSSATSSRLHGALQGLPPDPAHWSPRLANRIAEREGLVLEESHWQLIFCLREHFFELGPDWTARVMTHELARDFAEEGGRRHLYELFPHGPLAQGCRIAGVPAPKGTFNLSFGSVH